MRVSDVVVSEIPFHVEVGRGEMTMYGRLPFIPVDRMVTYMAAAPVDSRSSFSGSGIPHANRDQAFYGTPIQGRVAVENDGSFAILNRVPGSFYVGLGTVLVPPVVFVSFKHPDAKSPEVLAVPVDRPVAFRFGTWPMQFTRARDGPEFYKEEPSLPRTQEQILRDSAYPADNVMPYSFWGKKPPV